MGSNPTPGTRIATVWRMQHRIGALSSKRFRARVANFEFPLKTVGPEPDERRLVVESFGPVGADGYSADASSAVKKAKELIELRREKVPA